MDHHCCTTTAVWLQWSCLARNSFPWLSQEILMCTGIKRKEKRTAPRSATCNRPLYLICRLWPTIIFDLIPSGKPLYFTWPASSVLPLYLTCNIWPTFTWSASSDQFDILFDLQDLTYLYIWPAVSDLPLYLTCTLQPTFMFDLPDLLYLYIRPVISSSPLYLTCQLWPTFILASSDLPLYLTCQLWPTFILDLQAEVCSALRVGHRDPIEPRCSLCGDIGHDDKARGPEHYGLVRPTDTLQSNAVWFRLGAASAVCWRTQEGEGHFRWRWERCDLKADRCWVSVESHLTDVFISSRGACVADM